MQDGFSDRPEEIRETFRVRPNPETASGGRPHTLGTERRDDSCPPRTTDAGYSSPRASYPSLVEVVGDSRQRPELPLPHAPWPTSGFATAQPLTVSLKHKFKSECHENQDVRTTLEERRSLGRSEHSPPDGRVDVVIECKGHQQRRHSDTCTRASLATQPQRRGSRRLLRSRSFTARPVLRSPATAPDEPCRL